MKMMIISNQLSLVPWLWLLLVIISCLTETATSVSPNNYTVGGLLPSSTSANHIVMQSGYFQLDARSWNSKTSPGYLCMAGEKHTKINPGSTIWTAHGALPVAHRCQLRLSPTGLSLINMDHSAAAADWSAQTFKNVANMTLLESGDLVLQDSTGDVVWQSFHQTTVFSILPGVNFTTNHTHYSTDVSPDPTGVLHEDDIVYLYLRRDAARVDSGFVVWSYNIYNNKSESNRKASYMALDRNTSVFHFLDAQSRLIDRATILPPSLRAKPHGLDTNIAIIEHSGGYFTVKINPGSTLWAANGAQPVAHRCQFRLSPTGLSLINMDGDYVVADWSTPTFKNVANMTLLESGNLAGNIVWQNFHQTTVFGILPGRKFSTNNTLYSTDVIPDPIGVDDWSVVSGSYALRFHEDGIVYLYISRDAARVDRSGGDGGFVVWNYSTYNNKLESNSKASHTALDRNTSVFHFFDAQNLSTKLELCGIRTVPTYKIHRSRSRSRSSEQVLLRKIALNSSKSNRIIIILAALLCAATVLAVCCCCVIIYIIVRRRRRRKTKDNWETEFLQVMPRLPPRFSLKEMEAATQGFSAKLGSGGFGCVYEGTLPSGQKIAVKKLEIVGESNEVNRHRYKQTFRAELVSISAASHVNLVTLKGFCIDEGAKLLVYEYMANGSLDRWLFCKDVDRAELHWRRRFSIALDTAKGLAYLHHECAERIVHCDIKPGNILLDEKFRAKVADFGLSKMMESDKQGFTMTTVKGTRGYLAPEWLQESQITTKSDVYSYGVVLLELISGRRCLDAGGYLPVVLMQAMAKSIRSLSTASSSDEKQSKNTLSSNDKQLYRSGIVSVLQSLLDERLSKICAKQNSEELNAIKGKHACAEMTDNEEEDDSRAAAMERMVVVALWCVQRVPALRPTMASVVRMLESKEEVPPPVLKSASGEAFLYDDRVRFPRQSSVSLRFSEWASSIHPR